MASDQSEEAFVTRRIEESDTDFCSTASFAFVMKNCVVEDLRDEDQVYTSLYDFITTGGDAVDKWHKRHIQKR